MNACITRPKPTRGTLSHPGVSRFTRSRPPVESLLWVADARLARPFGDLSDSCVRWDTVVHRPYDLAAPGK